MDHLRATATLPTSTIWNLILLFHGRCRCCRKFLDCLKRGCCRLWQSESSWWRRNDGTNRPVRRWPLILFLLSLWSGTSRVSCSSMQCQHWPTHMSCYMQIISCICDLLTKLFLAYDQSPGILWELWLLLVLQTKHWECKSPTSSPSALLTSVLEAGIQTDQMWNTQRNLKVMLLLSRKWHSIQSKMRNYVVLAGSLPRLSSPPRFRNNERPTFLITAFRKYLQ